MWQLFHRESEIHKGTTQVRQAFGDANPIQPIVAELAEHAKLHG